MVNEKKEETVTPKVEDKKNKNDKKEQEEELVTL